MTQTNQNIRKAAAEAGVKLWQIADKLGYTGTGNYTGRCFAGRSGIDAAQLC